MSLTSLDPFTLEIIDTSMEAIVDEMFVATQRTAQSVIIYDMVDFAVGLTDDDGRLIGQGQGIPLFLGTLGAAVRSVLEKFGDDISPGDMFATNDPYDGGGTHLSDVTLVRPIFAGDERIGFACNKAHWTEMGGKSPGSVATDTTEIYQEGLQLPCLRVIERDVPVRAVRELIAANVRLPAMSIGDFEAQAASVRLGAERVRELCDKYGNAAVTSAIDLRLERSAELSRREVLALPDGEYVAEDLLDEDGRGGGPYPLRVTMTIAGDTLTCDFTGTADALTAPLNTSMIGLRSATRAAFLAAIGPHVPVSEGAFAPLRIVCPPRTLLSAERPTPTSVYWEVLVRVVDLVWQAFTQVVPERVTAGHFTTVASDLIAGTHPETGELFILFEGNAGGWGAGIGKDGERGLVCVGQGETYMIPIEVIEQRYGVRVEQYGFDVRDGAVGAGRWRGGQGIVKDYRILAEDAAVTSFVGRHTQPPWGAEGGAPGSVNTLEVHTADGSVTEMGMRSAVALRRGDLVRIRTATGGGWGDPRRRDPEAVARDVRDGFLSAQDALAIHGVAVP